ncbi:hypothetical protein [Streptomyces prunicolor]|uniref:hypothetical protein n=1 Tax=Streptomyces prunicolor TaxID=67348 RepID=UPI0034423D39
MSATTSLTEQNRAIVEGMFAAPNRGDIEVSSITVHYTIADGDRVAACVGTKDATTGELTHFIEQFTIKDGKIVENRVFYHNVGSMLDKPRVV